MAAVKGFALTPISVFLFSSFAALPFFSSAGSDFLLPLFACNNEIYYSSHIFLSAGFAGRPQQRGRYGWQYYGR